MDLPLKLIRCDDSLEMVTPKKQLKKSDYHLTLRFIVFVYSMFLHAKKRIFETED